MIRRDRHVRGAPLQHSEQRCEHAAHPPNLPARRIRRGRRTEMVPEEFVGSVYEVDVHGRDTYYAEADCRTMPTVAHRRTERNQEKHR